MATNTVNSKVLEILWKPSRHGYMIPIIHFEKVYINGCTIDHVFGQNAKYIVDNKIGPGAIVSVELAGNVIPRISKVIIPAGIPNIQM